LNVAAQPAVPGSHRGDVGAPLSLQQQRFWQLDRIAPGNPACNISVRWRLLGPLDLAILKRAIDEVVRRHEVLRTRVELNAGEPVQIIQPQASFEISFTDLGAREPASIDAEAQRLSEVEARKPFDLAHAPLFRASVLRLGENDHWMLLTIHHLVSDGWSMGIFADELCANYAACERGDPSPLPALTFHYRDYACWQRQTFNGNVSNPQLLYWLRQLKDLPRFGVPPDPPRTSTRTSSGSCVSILLPRGLTDALEDFSSRHGATFFMTALAALNVLLHLVTDLDTVLVSAPIAGRMSLETEPLIGLFINLLILRSDLSGDPPFVDLLATVRKTVLDALANQDVPFEQLIEVLRPRRESGANALCQVSFIFQRAFVRDQKFGRMSLVDLPSVSSGAPGDLNFFMAERAEGWRLSCELNSDLYRPATVLGMLEEFREIFAAIARDPAGRISQLGTGPREPGTPPGDALVRLIPLWEQVLGVASVRHDDDFFELGGNSLRAARLMALIAETFGRKLPLAVIFRSPTPRALALEIDAGAALDQAPRVIALDSVGDQPPFFMVNAFTGLVEIARRLDSGHPILSLIGDDDFALSGNYDLYQEARNHVSTILSTRDRGPYLVGGWSAGGIMAYEIAQQLEHLGHHVALLVLFDTANPFFMREYSKIEEFRVWVADSFRYHRDNLRTMDFARMPDYVGHRLRDHIERWRGRQTKAGSIMDAAVKPGEAGKPEPFEVRIEAARKYRPEPYPGRVLLFKRNNHLSGRYLDPSFGWLGTVTGDFDLCLVRSAHLDIFREEGRDLIARKLAVRLTEAVEDGASDALSSVASQLTQQNSHLPVSR
jgi:thioesterase domain-containing protein